MTRAQEIAQRAIVESACEWRITLDESPIPRVTRRRFAEWMLESPAHVREYLAAELTWALIGDAIKNDRMDVDPLDGDTASTVIPLETAS